MDILKVCGRCFVETNTLSLLEIKDDIHIGKFFSVALFKDTGDDIYMVRVALRMETDSGIRRFCLEMRFIQFLTDVSGGIIIEGISVLHKGHEFRIDRR